MLRDRFRTAILCAGALFVGCAVTKDVHHPDAIRDELNRIESEIGTPGAPLEKSAARLTGLLERHPSTYRVLSLRARIWLELDRPHDAIRDVAKLRELFKPEPDLLALAGRAYYEAGRAGEARRFLRESLDLDARNTTALLYTGRILADASAYDAAARYFRRVTEIDPSNGVAKGFLRALKAAGDPAALANVEDDAGLRRAGALLLDAGRYREATLAFLKVLAMNPDDVAALKGAGRGFAARRMDREAEKLFARAAKLRPDDADGRYRFASVLARLARGKASLLPRAAREFVKAAELAPSDPRAPHGAARAFVRMGDLVNAEKHFVAAFGKGTPSADLTNDYGLFVSRAGDFQRAIGIYRRGLEANPGDARLEANLMVALYRVGRPNEAGRMRDELAAREDLGPDVKRLVSQFAGGSR